MRKSGKHLALSLSLAGALGLVSVLAPALMLTACAPKPVHAMVLEAAFLDQPAHWPLLSDGGLDLIADAVLSGLRAAGVV